MNKLIQATFVLCIALLLSSCAKMETIYFNKANNTRTVKFTLNNGKTKLVNQKFHIKSYNWFEAECFDEIIIEFKNCPDDKIDFTKVGKTMIAQIENKESNSSGSKKNVLNFSNNLSTSNKEQSSSSEEQSSNSEEQSSNSEEQSSSSEELSFNIEDENIVTPNAFEFLFAR